jgi:hypothetical protein
VLGELRRPPHNLAPVYLRSFLAVMLALVLAPLAARADLAPKLAVYDLRVNGSVPESLGTDFATAIATEIRDDGGVNVVNGAPGLPASRDLGDAKAQGADYYLSGAIAPVGTRYSVICQLVSVRTGLMVWSSTFQAGSVDDARGQGTAARQALLDEIGRSTFPTVHATPAPAGFVAPANAVATPTPAPATFAVVTFGGSALPTDRALAARAALENIRVRGASAVTDSLQPQDLSVSGALACADTGAATVVGGTLATTRSESLTAPSSLRADIALQVYDCRTQQLSTKPLTFNRTAPISSDAIRSAAEDAIDAYFGGPAPTPRG